MEYEYLGSPADGPTLELDHEQFAYAGKFVMSNTGKTVVRDEGTLVGAVAFNEDHSAAETVRLRYVTVREDRRGEGIGPRLLRFTAESLARQFDEVVIAVNNPIAYQACYRAGFVSTGTETGLAELRLRYDPGDRSEKQYRDGFAVFRDRDLPDRQRAVISNHEDGNPPPVVAVPG